MPFDGVKLSQVTLSVYGGAAVNKSLVAIGILVLGCASAQADVMPEAQYATGVCHGLRAVGNISPHRPIAVRVQHTTDGSAQLFQCYATALGWVRAPVQRTVVVP